jgi:hypothetical protein
VKGGLGGHGCKKEKEGREFVLKKHTFAAAIN